MIIGIPVYDRVDLLDVTGPTEIFSWMNSQDMTVDVRIVAEQPGTVVSRSAGFAFQAPVGFDDAPQFDVLWVPGGDPNVLKVLMTDPKRRYLDFIVKQSAKTQWVCSVCEGALLLAQAGLLDGYTATTHWAFIPCLKEFPAITVAAGMPRFVVDRNRLTGGGISSGLDESLKLVELLTSYAVAQNCQIQTQYYPCPPVASTPPTATQCPFSW